MSAWSQITATEQRINETGPSIAIEKHTLPATIAMRYIDQKRTIFSVFS
jgi:hypothetical protein